MCAEKSVGSLRGSSLVSDKIFFSLAAFMILFLIFDSFIIVCLGEDLFQLNLSGTYELHDLGHSNLSSGFESLSHYF